MHFQISILNFTENSKKYVDIHGCYEYNEHMNRCSYIILKPR